MNAFFTDFIGFWFPQFCVRNSNINRNNFTCKGERKFFSLFSSIFFLGSQLAEIYYERVALEGERKKMKLMARQKSYFFPPRARFCIRIKNYHKLHICEIFEDRRHIGRTLWDECLIWTQCSLVPFLLDRLDNKNESYERI